MTADKILDFRSDTVTTPTEEMYSAIASSPLGDDVFGDDPTVNLLQETAAEILGKESALFTPSGTMANLIAVGVHTKPADEVIMEEKSHTFNFEVAGCARLWGIQTRTIMGNRGAMDPEKVKKTIRPKNNLHIPETALIIIENTHNFHGGAVIPIENIKEISKTARENKIKLHIDGARIMNASVKTGIKPSEYASYADSISVCLSKGLSAPVGSILAGTKGFIDKARRLRKTLGGAMRQAGVIAGPALVALKEGVKRLHLDHENARKLALSLSEIPDITIEVENVETNIVLFNLGQPIASKLSHEAFLEKLKAKNLLITSMAGEALRMVTHRNVDTEDVEEAVAIIGETLKECSNLR